MTITSLDARDEYTAVTAQVIFNYTFKIYDALELDVYITPAGQDADDATDIITTYTVDPGTIGNPNGGFIALDSATAAGNLVTIVSGIPFDRTVDYQNSGDFLPDTVNGDNDRQVSQIKQVADLANRSLLFPQALQNASSLSLPLPEAGFFLKWKVDLSGLENTGAPTVSVPGITVDTVTELLATILSVGEYVTTTGYTTVNDGGGATYIIEGSQAVDELGSHTISNGNTAIIVDNGEINILTYGGGVTNQLQASLEAAIATFSPTLGGGIYLPARAYVNTPMFLTGGFAIHFRGDGRRSAQLQLSVAGVGLTLSNFIWSSVRGIEFGTNQAGQALAGASGLTWDTGSSNCEVSDCSFIGFSQNGLVMGGTVGNQMSGNKIFDNFFLGNALTQLWSIYNNDFHIMNNQFGQLVPLAHPTFGCLLENSSAGTYEGNYHWNNEVGFKAMDSHYNRIVHNRMEESDKENVILLDGIKNTFNSNTVHTGSKDGDGLFDQINITGEQNLVITGNNVWTWDSSFGRYGISINAGCSRITMGKNQVTNFDVTKGPVFITGGGVEETVTGDLSYTGATSVGIVGGVTEFLGPFGSTLLSSQGFVVDRPCQISQFFVATDTPPGAAQSFTYTIFVNGVTTAMTGISTGAASFSAGSTVTVPILLLLRGETVTIEVVTTAGAATANHRYFVEFTEH